MRTFLNERGGSRLMVYFWLLLLVLVIHVALKVVPAYMDYSRMKDEMTIKAGVAQVLKDEDILRDLVQKAKQLDLPLGPENFIIKRDDSRRRMMISSSWDVEVHFIGGYYVRTFHFDPVVEEGIMNVVR